MDFDFREFMDGDQASEQEPAQNMQQAAAKVLQFQQQVPQAEEEVEENLENVDHRLEVAMMFRQFLHAPLFAESSPASRFVERRIRQFVVGELHQLFGQAPPQAPAPKLELPFSEDQVQALITLADSVLKQSTPKAKPAKPPEPKLRQPIAAPPPRVPTPVPAAVKPIGQAAPTVPAPTTSPAPSAPKKSKTPRNMPHDRVPMPGVEMQNAIMSQAANSMLSGNENLVSDVMKKG